jgi:hypothetical protein
MTEQLVSNVARLEFDVLRPGDHLQITTGRDDEAWKYDFAVELLEPKWPSGSLSATTPDGTAVDPLNFEMHGCGQYTTRRQNPVQQQMGIAFTPYYDGLITGSFLWGKFGGQIERSVFSNKGQEINQIIHTPLRENALLAELATAGALSIAQIADRVRLEQQPNLTKTALRETLTGLIKSGHISLLQKKVQLFELTESH